MDKIFLDTETTGLAPGQIAQLAYIMETDDGAVGAKNHFFEIDYISPDAEKVTGRGIDFYKQVAQGRKFKDSANEILNDLSGKTIIAHNEKFDENFLSAEFWRMGISLVPAGRFCTMEYFRDICKIPNKPQNKKYGEFKKPRLSEVIEFLNIDENKIQLYTQKLFGECAKGFHDAMFDTTSMFVAFHVHKDMMDNKSDWIDTFCK